MICNTTHGPIPKMRFETSIVKDDTITPSLKPNKMVTIAIIAVTGCIFGMNAKKILPTTHNVVNRATCVIHNVKLFCLTNLFPLLTTFENAFIYLYSLTIIPGNKVIVFKILNRYTIIW